MRPLTLSRNKELSLAALQSKHDAQTDDDRIFASGRLMAFHEIVSLMQQQAISFELGFAEIGLGDIDPEKDLL